jgi:hypothetical protein
MRIADVLDRVVAGFNANSLDDVMAYFADDAVYRPGDGSEHGGREAIRQAFLPQFSGAYGAMRFVVDDRIIDEGARKATIRWVCQHELTKAVPWGRRWLLTTLFGRRCGWYGADVFHFDEAGKITAKFTYANYRRPLMRRDLGGVS